VATSAAPCALEIFPPSSFESSLAGCGVAAAPLLTAASVSDDAGAVGGNGAAGAPCTASWYSPVSFEVGSALVVAALGFLENQPSLLRLVAQPLRDTSRGKPNSGGDGKMLLAALPIRWHIESQAKLFEHWPILPQGIFTDPALIEREPFEVPVDVRFVAELGHNGSCNILDLGRQVLVARNHFAQAKLVYWQQVEGAVLPALSVAFSFVIHRLVSNGISKMKG
jgi:hypothetical protein